VTRDERSRLSSDFPRESRGREALETRRRARDADEAAKRGQVSRRRFVPLSSLGSSRVERPAGRKIVAAAAAAAVAAAAISGAAAAFGGSRALRARRPS